jgi:hypothetical protein
MTGYHVTTRLDMSALPSGQQRNLWPTNLQPFPKSYEEIKMPRSKTSDMQTKTIKVPLVINEDNKEIRDLKYRALSRAMGETRYLANKAIRYLIAYGLKDIPKALKPDGKEMHPDTRVYQLLKEERKYLNSVCYAAALRKASQVLNTTNRDAWAGKKSLPGFTSLFLAFRAGSAKIEKIESRRGDVQFKVTPGLGERWLTDQLIADLNEDKNKRKSKNESVCSIEDAQRGMSFISCFSHKDRGALEVIQRIVSGEYLFSDSIIKKIEKHDSRDRKTTKFMAFISYKHKIVAEILDIEKVCGVVLGATTPAICMTNLSSQRFIIGDGYDVMAAKAMFRAQRRRKQRRLGHYTKSTKWERSKTEKNWVDTYCHALTRQIIKYCIQNGCGTLRFAEVGTFTPIISAPYKVKSMLAYKAAEKGIAMEICETEIGGKCSSCGHVGSDDESHVISKNSFECGKCGKTLPFDINAAKNMADIHTKALRRARVQ